MGESGLCCANLQEPKSLMKMGLCLVLVGHINFLLGALVHGTVLRHVGLNAQTIEYAISNILAVAAGLAGVVVGIFAIIRSKNEKNQLLTWTLCLASAAAGLLAAASTVGLLLSLTWVIIYGSKGLLLQCNLPEGMSYFSITDECPFDPTRIYGTTIILWVPLIVTSVVETTFSGRCFAVCISFLRHKTTPQYQSRSVKTLRAAELPVPPCYVPLPRRYHGHGKTRCPQRPLEQHELLRASRPHSSTRSAPNRSPRRFNRAEPNRASFWI